LPVNKTVSVITAAAGEEAVAVGEEDKIYKFTAWIMQRISCINPAIEYLINHNNNTPTILC
jgi:hypothetical protein